MSLPTHAKHANCDMKAGSDDALSFQSGGQLGGSRSCGGFKFGAAKD